MYIANDQEKTAKTVDSRLNDNKLQKLGSETRRTRAGISNRVKKLGNRLSKRRVPQGKR
jgi:hypothetical protein